MKAAYWQRGEALDYVNATAEKIEANTVLVIGDCIGVAGMDILPDEVGAVHVAGVFEMDKVDTTEIPMGKKVYLAETGITAAASVGEGDSATANAAAGYAAAPAAADAKKIYVKING